MGFYDLSPQLMLEVIDHLGPEFFIADISRLHVSKQWYKLARQVLLNKLQLPIASIPSFLEYAEDVAVKKELKRHVNSMDLCFPPVEEWAFPDAETLENNEDMDDMSLLVSEVTAVMEDLDELAKVAKQLPKLHALRYIVHADALCPVQFGPLIYMDVMMVSPFLAMKHLTSLHLEFTGISQGGWIAQPQRRHLCVCVNTLLRNGLQRLRCRFGNMCEQLLDLPESGPELALQELVINLSMSGLSSWQSSVQHTENCSQIPLEPPQKLRAAIEDQATQIVSRLKSPKIVRVLDHMGSSKNLCSFDALTGRRMQLAPGALWDADGEEVEAGGSDDEASSAEPFE